MLHSTRHMHRLPVPVPHTHPLALLPSFRHRACWLPNQSSPLRLPPVHSSVPFAPSIFIPPIHPVHPRLYCSPLLSGTPKMMLPRARSRVTASVAPEAPALSQVPPLQRLYSALHHASGARARSPRWQHCPMRIHTQAPCRSPPSLTAVFTPFQHRSSPADPAAVVGAAQEASRIPYKVDAQSVPHSRSPQ